MTKNLKRMAAMLLTTAMLTSIYTAAFAESPDAQEETSVAVETAAPVVSEAPAPVQEPAKAEAPVEAEKAAVEPAKAEAPVVAEKAAVETAETEARVEAEAPVEIEAPAETEAPVEIEVPAENEEPAVTEEPAETEAPVEIEAPAENEEPAATEEPAETEAPVEIEAPAENEEPAETETPDLSNVVIAELMMGVVWNDNGNAQGLRPGSVEITLRGSNGSEYIAKVTQDSGNAPWTYTFTNLPAYADGQQIVYTLDAVRPENYSMDINQDTLTVSNTICASVQSEEETVEPETDGELEADPVITYERDENGDLMLDENGDPTIENTVPAGAQKIQTLEDALDPNRSIDMYAVWEGDTLYFGNKATLVAVLNGYDQVVYTLQWQTSADNTNWEDVAGGTSESVSVVVTEDNYRNYWRVVVTVTDVMNAEAE